MSNKIEILQMWTIVSRMDEELIFSGPYLNKEDVIKNNREVYDVHKWIEKRPWMIINETSAYLLHYSIPTTLSFKIEDFKKANLNELKSTALSKLTAEEKEALGL